MTFLKKTCIIYLALKNGYTIDDLIDNIVGNLIGVLAAFLLFDILNNKLTQDAYARETSQQITKTLMGEPEILDSFSDEDKKTFLKSTISSMIRGAHSRHCRRRPKLVVPSLRT